MTGPSLLVTTEEAGSMLALTPAAVREQIRRGQIPAVRLGRRSWRIVRKDIETFVATGRWPTRIEQVAS